MGAGNDSRRKSVVFLITAFVIAVLGVVWRFGVLSDTGAGDKSPITIRTIESAKPDSTVSKSSKKEDKGSGSRKGKGSKKSKESAGEREPGRELFEDNVNPLQN